MTLCACGCGTPTSGKRNPNTGECIRYRAGHNNTGKGKFGPSQRAPGYHKKWRDANPGKTRQYGLKTKYGITPGCYDEMYDVQGGKCLICRRKKKRLVVDHNHHTGAVRGLLCDLCNTGIGKLSDDSRRLRRAADYLDAARTGRMSSSAASNN